jgi:hypothetical protein
MNLGQEFQAARSRLESLHGTASLACRPQGTDYGGKQIELLDEIDPLPASHRVIADGHRSACIECAADAPRPRRRGD